MAKKDYSKLASQLVQAVGGKENIESVTNCMTRIRFNLLDDSQIDDEKVKSIGGVMGVVRAGGQYQCIIGTHVTEVMPFVLQETGQNEDQSIIAKAVNESKKDNDIKKDNAFNKVMKNIAGCILPAIGVLAGGGILQGLLAASVSFGLLTKTDGTYMLLYAAANSILYFMPIIVGFAAGKVFGMNQYLSAVLGAALLYPTLLSAYNEGVTISFLGIQVALENYANSFLPIILEIYIASKLEKGLKKIIPSVMQLMFIPLIVLTIMVPLTYLAVGPVMNMLSNGIADGMMVAYNFSPIIMGFILGAFWQVIVMLGLLHGMAAILINDITTNGYSSIGAIMGLTVWAVAGVGLGYSLKIKDKEKRGLSLGTFASAMCGITEPVLYTICMSKMKYFVSLFVGGGLAGALGSALGLKLYTFGGDGIFKFAGMINPDGMDSNITIFIITALVALLGSAIVSYIVTDPQKD